MAPMMGAYPFEPHDLNSLRHLPPIRVMPGGLLAVRKLVAPHRIDRRTRTTPQAENSQVRR
jgi:hypothetical protein